jgi:hypothetical protein
VRVGISVECTVCRRRKAPVGRSVPDVMAGSMCDDDCSGYRQEPSAGSLWPGETDADFGFPVCPCCASREMTPEEVAAWAKEREE